MVEPGQECHLPAAVAGTSRWHVGLLVPAQHSRARAQDRLFPRSTDQFVVSPLGIHDHRSMAILTVSRSRTRKW